MGSLMKHTIYNIYDAAAAAAAAAVVIV